LETQSLTGEKTKRDAVVGMDWEDAGFAQALSGGDKFAKDN
jgi:hypothetical protein